MFSGEAKRLLDEYIISWVFNIQLTIATKRLLLRCGQWHATFGCPPTVVALFGGWWA